MHKNDRTETYCLSLKIKSMFLTSLSGNKIHGLPSIWLVIMGTLPVLICNVLTFSVTSPRGTIKQHDFITQ